MEQAAGTVGAGDDWLGTAIGDPPQPLISMDTKTIDRLLIFSPPVLLSRE
jgi:hypothetical protein